MTSVEKILNVLDEAKADFESGYGGTKAAARRARKALQEIRQLAYDSRQELLAIMKEEEDPKEISLDSE